MPAPKLPAEWSAVAAPTNATACRAPGNKVVIEHDWQRFDLTAEQAVTFAERLLFALHCSFAGRPKG